MKLQLGDSFVASQSGLYLFIYLFCIRDSCITDLTDIVIIIDIDIDITLSLYYYCLLQEVQ